jgi:hypothetical protein
LHPPLYPVGSSLNIFRQISAYWVKVSLSQDFDIDDSNRALPPHIFDIDGTYIIRYSDTFHSQAWLDISCDIY